MAAQFPDLAEPFYNKIAGYCQQKLWHQLTVAVLEFVGASANLRSLDAELKNTFYAVYQNVMLVSASKLNALSLARIAAATASASLAAGSLSAEESKKLLEDLAEKQESGKPLATATTLFLESKIALLQLQNSQDNSK